MQQEILKGFYFCHISVKVFFFYYYYFFSFFTGVQLEGYTTTVNKDIILKYKNTTKFCVLVH